MPIDSRSFVKPSLRLGCIDAHHKNIFSKLNIVCNIEIEFAVAAEIPSEEMSVEPNDAIAEDAIELDNDPFPFIRRRDSKRSTIPPDTCFRKCSPDRLEAVIVQRLLFRLNEFKLDRPIVGDVQCSP